MTPAMKPEEMKAARKELGLTQAQLGRALRLQGSNTDRTVRMWEDGDREISGPVSLAIEYLLERHRAGRGLPG